MVLSKRNKLNLTIFLYNGVEYLIQTMPQKSIVYLQNIFSSYLSLRTTNAMYTNSHVPFNICVDYYLQFI